MAPTTSPNRGGSDVVVDVDGVMDAALLDHSLDSVAIFSKRVRFCCNGRDRRSLDPGLDVLQRMNAPLLEYFPVASKARELNICLVRK